MDMLLVHGGRRLRGTARVSGAKNAALPIMAAALMADGVTRLESVPELADVETLALVLRSLGMRVERAAPVTPTLSPAGRGQGEGESGRLELEVVDASPCVAHYDLVRRMRASICVLGPLVARRGRACVSLPGGCNIGDRPIDLHLKGLAALGARVAVERGYVMAEARRLRGARVFLGGPFGSTVTGTANILCAAALAEGVTVIESAACEPEVVDLGNFLVRMGARIEGLGTPTLRIEGVPRLQAVEHRVIPDRIEAATLMIAAAITGGEVTVENVRLDQMTAVVEKLREIGVFVEPAGRSDQATGSQRAPNSEPSQPPVATHDSAATTSMRVAPARRLSPADVIALPYPGLPTDVQAQLMALLSLVEGMSIITDKVFPDRFMHAAELARLGARVRREGSSAIITGVHRLSGASVMASDLRASAALVLAGLAADGTTAVRRIYHLDRGYEGLERKLMGLGAEIKRMAEDAAQTSVEPPATWLTGPHFSMESERAASRPAAQG